MKKLTSLLLLLLLLGCKNPTDEKTYFRESAILNKYLNDANQDSIDVTNRKISADKALQIVLKHTNDSISRLNLFKVANRYYNMNLLGDYKKLTFLIVSKSKESGDTLSLAKAYSYLGDYYASGFVSDSAFSYYNKAEKLYRIKGDNQNIAKNLLNKAVIQFNGKDYIGCERSALSALKLLQRTENLSLLYDASNLLGIMYGELKEYNDAILYHNRALQITKDNRLDNNQIYRASSLTNLGAVFINKKDFRTGRSLFVEALNYPDLFVRNAESFVAASNNLGYCNLQLNIFNDLPYTFQKNMNIADSLGITPSMIKSRLYLGAYYKKRQDFKSAKIFLLEAYHIAKTNKLSNDLLLSLNNLLEIDLTNTQYYSTEYIRVSDSIQLQERQTRNKLARIEYETEELAIEKEKLIESRKKVIYSALAIILLGVLAYVIRFQAAKNRELRLVQEQQKANEEIYQLMLNQQNKVEEVRQAEKKRIAQELHDGVLGKLFGTRMNLGVLNTKLSTEGIDQRGKYIDELKSVEQEIREISHDLSSEKAAVFNNFVLMVSNFIETQRTVCKAAIQYEIDPGIDWNSVDNMKKINFYRILQEAFQNINKHSSAGEVNVLFKDDNGLIRLSVIDDGVGFIYSKKRNGIGLQNMLSRITASGGKMDIKTAVGEGTHLIFEMPLT